MSGTQPSLRQVLEALIGLVVFDVKMKTGGVKEIQNWISKIRFREAVTDSEAIPSVCSAVERACVYYPVKKACLPRSAVLTCLLRRRGVPARLILAGRKMPVQAHAWVEVNGTPINEAVTIIKIYKVLHAI